MSPGVCLFKNADFSTIDANVMDGSWRADTRVGLIFNGASGDAGFDRLCVEDEFVVDIEGGVVAVWIVCGRPVTDVVFAFVLGMVDDVELEMEGELWKGKGGGEELVVLVEGHEVKDGMVEAKDGFVRFPENIVGGRVVAKIEIVMGVFRAIDVIIWVGADMLFGGAGEAEEEEAGGDLAIFVGTVDYAMEKEVAADRDEIALFTGGFKELLVICLAFVDRKTAGRNHDDWRGFSVGGARGFLGGVNGEGRCAVIVFVH